METPITGYRQLNDAEVQTINEIKALANKVGELIAGLPFRSDVTHEVRWAAIAQTDLQKGFMGLVRAVAKPESF